MEFLTPSRLFKGEEKEMDQKLPKLRIVTGADAREVRWKLRLNQSDFWGKLLVGQAGGSRYEGGRAIPVPVRLLLNITYGTPKQAEQIVNFLRRKPKQEPAYLRVVSWGSRAKGIQR